MNPAYRIVAIFSVSLVACTESPDESARGVSIAVAPLALPSVGKVCYDIEVTNGPDKSGDTVWSKGTPGLNGGTPDNDAVCSTQYGNDGGGDITYIGPCDADGPDGERMNSVTVWFDGLYDDGLAYIDPAGPQGWQNPCVDADGNEVGCTLNVLCEDNADALVEFNFTVMRQANQGFFDVAVNFNDIFCSAKFDCSYASEGVCSGPGGGCTTGTLVAGKATCDTDADCVVEDPIELLHDGAGERDRTFVLGFACTAGPGADVATELYLNDLELDCNSDDDPDTFNADFTLSTAGVIDGNQCEAGKVSECGVLTTGNEALDPDDFVYQFAVYRGEEELDDDATDAPLNKAYWNLALGVNPAIAGCRIRIAGTAEDANDPDDGAQDGVIAPGHVYPVIAWDVDAATCRQERASVAPAGGFFANAISYATGMIRLQYTAPTHTGAGFANVLSATLPVSERCSVSRPCAPGYRCTGAGECLHETTGAGQPYCSPWVNVFGPDVTPIASATKAGKEPQDWRMLTNGRVGVKQFANTYASVYPTLLQAEAGEIVFEVGSESASDDDVFGWTVNAQGTASTLGVTGGELMLFKWDGLDARLTNSTNAVGRERGLRLYRVTGRATEGQLLEPTGPVQLVQSAATLGDTAWTSGLSYRVRMTYSDTQIRVWVTPSSGIGPDGNPQYGPEPTTPELDVGGTFPTGLLGFYSDSQRLVHFSVVSVDGQVAAPIGCGSAQDATCAAGAPAIITDIEQRDDEVLFHYVLCGDRNPSDFSTSNPRCLIGQDYAWSNANASNPSPLSRPLPEDFDSFTSCTLSFYGAQTITTPPFVLKPTPCMPNPCANGGTCTLQGDDAFTCACAPGWTGTVCTLDIDACDVASPELLCGKGKKACQDALAPLTSYTCVRCAEGYRASYGACVPRNIPLWDPYLPYTHTEAWNASPHHGLDAINESSSWYFPDTYDDDDRVLGETIEALASDRLIFEDALTGAEVWLMARSPQAEDVVYTNERRFNADGSLIRVGTLVSSGQLYGPLMCTNGARAGSPECEHSDIPRVVAWDRHEPDVYTFDNTDGRYLLTLDDALVTRAYATDLDQVEPVDPIEPEFSFPPAPIGAQRDLSADLSYLCQMAPWGPETVDIYMRTPGTPSPTYEPFRSFAVRTDSSAPQNDKLGTIEFLTDTDGNLYLRYSLNKEKNSLREQPTSNPNPYQNWMVNITDAQASPVYIELNSKSVPYNDLNKFLIPASEFPSTGHGGFAPSGDFFAVQTDDSCKVIRDFRKPNFAANLIGMKLPSCDHMDWTVDDSLLHVWVRDNGTPIYRVETAFNALDQLVTRNLFRVVAPQACTTNYFTDVYQNASPDGTKVLYASNMLSAQACPDKTAPGYNFNSKVIRNALDLYMAVVEPPKPPAALTVTRAGSSARLEWPRAQRTRTQLPTPSGRTGPAREVVGYHVYRSAQSGRGYVRLPPPAGSTTTWVTGTTFIDPDPGPTSHYVVTSVEHSGLESRDFSPEAALAWGADVRVFWEAEEGELGARMREVFLPAECSANFAVAKAIHDPNWNAVLGSARITWKVSLPTAGAWTLWARARSRTGVSASGDVTIGQQGGFTLTATSATWTWIRVAGASAIGLSAGSPYVTLLTADAALEIDKLLLTTETNPVLEGYGDLPWFDTTAAVTWPASPSSVASVSGSHQLLHRAGAHRQRRQHTPHRQLRNPPVERLPGRGPPLSQLSPQHPLDPRRRHAEQPRRLSLFPAPRSHSP